jgi:uncharacterized protein (DUF1697 family)
MPTPQNVHVALLRGINVGGKNKIPMKGLAKLFVAAGCAEVRTYIQSGNVVFRASDAAAARIGAAVTAAIEKRFGLAVPVVVRSAAELREVVRNNPFIGKGDDGALFVSFLADRPDRGKVASLDPKRSPPDQFLVRGGEVYLKLLNGAAKTKLTNAYFDSKLSTISTARNWRTTLTLMAMATEE